jgi:hypothetical protein
MPARRTGERRLTDMTMTMDAWNKKKREEWTRARDTAKVKKGAVGNVSIGDDLDNIYGASKKGYRSLLAAIEKAEKDIKTYQTKGGKAVDPVKGWLKSLGDDLDKLQKAAQTDGQMLAKFWPRLVEFHQLAVPGYPDSHDAGKTVKLVAGDATGATTWADAAKTVGLYRAMPEVLKLWAETIQNLKGMSFQLTLPGKEAQYKALAGLPARYDRCFTMLKDVAQVKSVDEHFQQMKAITGPMTDLDVGASDIGKVVKSLMG